MRLCSEQHNVLCSVPAWERAAAVSQRHAAEPPEPDDVDLRAARDKLCSLLEESALYDASLVLEAVAGSELWDEQVLLHCRVRMLRCALSELCPNP